MRTLILTLTAATSPTMEMDPRWIIISVGLLFVVVGNVLGKVQSNWFIGIRTPWTLQSEKVWHKTHRVGAWSFGLGGLVAVLAALVLPASTLVWVMLPAFLGAGIVPVVYSYVAYRQLGDEAPTP